MAVEIRPLVAGDRAEWDRLWTAYLRFYDTSVVQEVYDTTFSHLLSDDPATFRAYIGTVSGQPAGLVHYVFHPHCWRVEPVCYLQDLFVEETARGTGLRSMPPQMPKVPPPSTG